MGKNKLIISKLEGFSGIRLKGNRPLVFKPGINLLVGRNGSGKTNLMSLIQRIATGRGDLKNRIESSFFVYHLKEAAKGNAVDVEKRFGTVTIANYAFGDRLGSIKMTLTNCDQPHVIKNLLEPGANFEHHFGLSHDDFDAKFTYLSGNESPIKFESSGNVNANPLPRVHDSKAHKLMGGEIDLVKEYLHRQMLEVYRSPEFIARITKLEEAINLMFAKFLGTANKNIKIDYHDIGTSGKTSLSLMDHDNYIDSINISTGETILLNLIFSLSVVKEEKLKIVAMDEPDVHMHDDMIQVLVDELFELTKVVPDCIFIIASHSTALIEKLAVKGKESINIISFDQDRRVSNNERDVDLINALSQNGVKFSPLMLSRRKNIFIENQLNPQKDSRSLLMKFFVPDNVPNIIPIGTSGNVKDVDSFNGILKDILRNKDINAVGILDGDMWFKDKLKDYLSGKTSLSEFISNLIAQERAYIPSGSSSNLYYFNFWEIENLYLLGELRTCWKDKSGNPLTMNHYLEILNQNRDVVERQFLKMFYKSIIDIKPNQGFSVAKVREFIDQKVGNIHRAIPDNAVEMVEELASEIHRKNLLNWLPGKEIVSLLKSKDFKFDDNSIQYENLVASIRIREMLELN
ncbi:MAG: ATP-binding protein [Cyclobacteriaceae bacterium]|nr:ATP-binding protein [Cyclobacteriaceae bacterium]